MSYLNKITEIDGGLKIMIVPNKIEDRYIFDGQAVCLWTEHFGHAKPRTVRPENYVVGFIFDESGNMEIAGLCGKRRIGKIGEICHLSVHPRFRGMGVGKRLFADREQSLIDSGCSVILVNIRKTNTIMRTFLTKRAYRWVFEYNNVDVFMRSFTCAE